MNHPSSTPAARRTGSSFHLHDESWTAAARRPFTSYSNFACTRVSTARAAFIAALLVLFGAAAFADDAGEKKTARLFILSGQSNAGGAGVGSELPAELKKLDPEVLMCGRHVRGLQPLQPYRRRGFGADNTAFGAELVFAKRMKEAYPDEIICVVKQTKGGCSIIAWDMDWRREAWTADLKLADNVQKGAQYPLLMEKIREAVAALKASQQVGHVEYGGFLWIQSERDDHHPRTAAMYEANLRKLIANVRADLDSPDLPFLFADANVRRNPKVMRDGMKRIAAETPRTAVVSIQGLTKRDAVHYDTRGQITLGGRFADAYLEIVGK